MLWLYQRVFFNELNENIARIEPMGLREALPLLTLSVFVFWIGIYPDTFLSFMHVSVNHLLERVNYGVSDTMMAIKGMTGGY